eukprot:7530446-Pyramimonas_sp.AAC.1
MPRYISSSACPVQGLREPMLDSSCSAERDWAWLEPPLSPHCVLPVSAQTCPSLSSAHCWSLAIRS